MRSELEVHAAQRSGATAAGQTLLRKIGRQTGGCELVDAKRSREEASLVFPQLRANQIRTGKR
jgi:hypothetical protein